MNSARYSRVNYRRLDRKHDGADLNQGECGRPHSVGAERKSLATSEAVSDVGWSKETKTLVVVVFCSWSERSSHFPA